MKVLIDMNLSPYWTEYFISKNINAVHWSVVGKATDPDTIIFEYARENGYVVFTNDLDFGSILAATNANGPSVFQLRSQSLLPDTIGDIVLACLNNYVSYLDEGCLITLSDQKSKVRILPLRS
jgi:predicted nuclease of predicted toxin-antitoxin system